MKTLIAIFISLSIVNLSYAGFDYEAQDARIKELDEICLQSRTALLKQVQKVKIDECVNSKGKERSYCERFYRDYGWGNRTNNYIERHFHQIPDCIEAFNFSKNRKM